MTIILIELLYAETAKIIGTYQHFSKAEVLRNIYNRKHDLLEEYTDYEYANNEYFDKISNHFQILKVQKINNSKMYGIYLLHKEEMQLDYSSGEVYEKTLFHGTSISNAISIAQKNIDWRLTNRTRFGKGACFSPCPFYANKYAGMKGAFLIVKVLVKKTETTGINYNLEIPSTEGCDTTVGNGGNVFVKYDDNTFYPEYIVHYS